MTNLCLRYWTQHYAQPAAAAPATATASAPQAPPAPESLYGIDPQVVRQFTDMGFGREPVVDVLRRLGIKRLEAASAARADQENRILEKLLAEAA